MDNEERRQQARETVRKNRAEVERAFNDFLSAVWMAELKPSEVEFTVSQSIAHCLLGGASIKVKEFWYQSDVGNIHVRVKENKK